MTKIAVILILVGLAVMASAYNLRRPHFDQNVLREKDEEAQLKKQGISSLLRILQINLKICEWCP